MGSVTCFALQLGRTRGEHSQGLEDQVTQQFQWLAGRPHGQYLGQGEL